MKSNKKFYAVFATAMLISAPGFCLDLSGFDIALDAISERGPRPSECDSLNVGSEKNKCMNKAQCDKWECLGEEGNTKQHCQAVYESEMVVCRKLPGGGKKGSLTP